MEQNFVKIEKRLKTVLKKFWQRLFLVLIFLLVLDLFLAGISFWKYYLAPREKILQGYLPLRISQVLIDDFSQDWQEREVLFEKASEKVHRDIFRGVD